MLLDVYENKNYQIYVFYFLAGLEHLILNVWQMYLHSLWKDEAGTATT